MKGNYTTALVNQIVVFKRAFMQFWAFETEYFSLVKARNFNSTNSAIFIRNEIKNAILHEINDPILHSHQVFYRASIYSMDFPIQIIVCIFSYV